jgi:hypothetical protein
VCIVMLAGCGYGKGPNYKRQTAESSQYDLAVVEFNDEGAYWDATSAKKALDLVAERAAQGNTVVVLYAHGWHHNAADGDSNLQGLRTTLEELVAKLDQPGYRKSRLKLTESEEVRVMGIYIGWRGKSLPMPLDFLTFWGRKAAAERVGKGDLGKFMTALQVTYDQANPPGRLPFLGLLSVGHSFGGQALFKATAQRMRDNLADRAGGPMHGFGDFSLLLNPALEASQYAELHDLQAKSTFDCRQTPVLLTISGDGDWARKWLFPAGRLLTPGNDGGERSHRALGEFAGDVTHRLEPDKDSVPTLGPDDYEDTAGFLARDFTAPIVLGGASLRPAPDVAHKPYAPLVVAATSKKIVQGHSGIFTEAFRDFLTDYAAYVQGKHILLRKLGPVAPACSAPASAAP